MSETLPLKGTKQKTITIPITKVALTLSLFVVAIFGVSFLDIQVPNKLIQISNTEITIDSLTTAAYNDYIQNLPGLSKQVNEHQFSGYLALANGVKLHYWFVESQDHPETDPICLWLNGGPGASSLGGLFYENGPFLIDDAAATLKRNPYAWNRHANMLYFEAPVGVGFSYNSSGRYVSNDFLQAQDNYEALLLFFDRFPHLRKNAFYVTGESYGGVYVPTLAKAIVDGNKGFSNSTNRVNLVGFAVGNGVNEYSFNSQLFFAYYHGLFGGEIWKELQRNCPSLKEFEIPNFNFFDIASMSGANATMGPCFQSRQKAFAYMMSSHINSYDIYRKCSHGDPNYGIDKLIKELMPHPNNGKVPPIAQPLSLPMSLCLNSTAGVDYLNRKDVKNAIHVPEELSWSDIVMTNVSFHKPTMNLSKSNKTVLNYGMPLDTHVTPIWKYLLQNGIRGVIYHGDVDFMCDFIGGQWAVDSLGYNVSVPYQPWHIVSTNRVNQTGGFVKEFESNLSFVTIKGAGHMAPQWRPAESLHMFERFVLKRTNVDI